MEADWEVEIGAGAPIIDALWAGYVDLTTAPALVKLLAEVALLPQLEQALLRLNDLRSPVWTAKCDVWPIADTNDLDPDELDASVEDTAFAWCCYVDLLPRGEQWSDAAQAVGFGRSICGQLQEIPFRCCRADLVVRGATMSPDELAVGITAYLTACGATEEAAKQVLGQALTALTDALCGQSAIE